MASILSYLLHVVFGISEAGIWRYAVINFIAFGYFYIRWSARNAQHRLFHFILLSSYLITTTFYVYQLWVGTFLTDAVGVSPWWFQLFDNIIFEAGLVFITIYALLFRRSRKSKTKYKSDYEGWLQKASATKKAIKTMLDGKSSGPNDL